MSYISFNPRWKEELVATSKEGTLIFEITMGQLHVYFPDQNKWLTSAPDWARDKWQLYADACTLWCAQNHVPLSITDSTFMYEERK